MHLRLSAGRQVRAVAPALQTSPSRLYKITPPPPPWLSLNSASALPPSLATASPQFLSILARLSYLWPLTSLCHGFTWTSDCGVTPSCHLVPQGSQPAGSVPRDVLTCGPERRPKERWIWSNWRPLPYPAPKLPSLLVPPQRIPLPKVS